MVELVKKRMNLANRFDTPEVTFPFEIDFIPHGPALSEWTVMSLDDYWNNGRFQLPIEIKMLPGQVVVSL